MSGSSGIEPAVPRGADERGQALRFLRHGSAAQPGDRKVFAPRVHVVRSGNRCHQAFLGQPSKGLVERAGRRIQPPARLLLDPLADGELGRL